MRILTTDGIPFDPAPYLTGTTVDVHITPDDPAHHHVNVSFLPRPAR